MEQVVEEIAVPMVHGLINELDDGFHCSPVLEGFRVFEMKDIPQSLPELLEYGKVQ